MFDLATGAITGTFVTSTWLGGAAAFLLQICTAHWSHGNSPSSLRPPDGETDELVAKQIMIARMARRNPQSLPPL